MNERSQINRQCTSARRLRGQSMVEYIVILAFGMLVLLGPGTDIMRALRDVLRNNYGSYSYAMSLSPLPDFGTGPDLATYIDTNAVGPKVDPRTVERLTVDPVQSAIASALNRIAPLTAQFNNLNGVINQLPGLPTNCRSLMQGAGIPINC